MRFSPPLFEQNTNRPVTMNKHFVHNILRGRWGVLTAIALVVLPLSRGAVAQTAYPEFYVGQATGSGLDVTSPSDQADPTGGIPALGEKEADGAIVLSNGLNGSGDWGLESIGGSPACDCCPPRFYVIGELLAMNREGNSGVRLSQALQLGEFHYREGFRATIGWTDDCLNGYEITFTRPLKWERGEFAVGTALNSNLIAAPNVNPVDLAAFNTAIFHSQRYRSEFYSGEFNRRWWGWDVFSVKGGLRYINVDEEFEFRSINNLNAVGEFRVEVDNHLIGPQLGVELLQPLGKWTLNSKILGGVFVNINDEQTTLSNAGVQFINNSFNDEDFAWMIETGVTAIYHFGDHLSATIGYEGWFLDGIVVAEEQQLNPIDRNMGLRSDARSDIFYHGATAGVELVW